MNFCEDNAAIEQQVQKKNISHIVNLVTNFFKSIPLSKVFFCCIVGQLSKLFFKGVYLELINYI